MAHPKAVVMLFNNLFKKQRGIVIGVLALIAVLVIYSGYIAIRSSEDRLPVLWASTENNVEVKLSIIKPSSGQLRLSAIFTPTRPGFYLYSKDLPKDGLQGMGRPTLLEVVKSDSIKITGALEADQPVKNLYVNALDLSFPVYPAGPVTLSIPFELTGHSAFIGASITYMACNDTTCLPPVINKYVNIQVPDKLFNE